MRRCRRPLRPPAASRPHILAEDPGPPVHDRVAAAAGGIPGLMSLDAIRQFVSQDARRLAQRSASPICSSGIAGEARWCSSACSRSIVLLLIVRSALSRRPGRHRLVVPALPRSMRRSPLVRGAPRAARALSGRAAVLHAGAGRSVHRAGHERVTYPGRRISVMIDASTSMRTPFKAAASQHAAPRPTPRSSRPWPPRSGSCSCASTASTAISWPSSSSATRRTSSRRSRTTTTTSCSSISLIGDPVEFSMFPDQGTIIAQAIDQSVGLFKAFKFLDASGNMMVIFTDGEDTHAIVERHERSTRSCRSTIDAKSPGVHGPDELRAQQGQGDSRRALDSGHREDRRQVLMPPTARPACSNAIKEIERVSAGTIRTTQYSSQQPRFAMFALIAACCWTGAATLEADRAALSEASVGSRYEEHRGWNRFWRCVLFVVAAACLERSASDPAGRGGAPAAGDAALRPRGRHRRRSHASSTACRGPAARDRPTSKRHRATVTYWLARYDSLAESRWPTGQQAVNDPTLLFVAANAAFRTSAPQVGDRKAAVERLDGVDSGLRRRAAQGSGQRRRRLQLRVRVEDARHARQGPGKRRAEGQEGGRRPNWSASICRPARRSTAGPAARPRARR